MTPLISTPADPTRHLRGRSHRLTQSAPAFVPAYRSTTRRPSRATPDGPPPGKGPFLKRIFRDPLLDRAGPGHRAGAGGRRAPVGVELYARHRANEVVAEATACVVQDSASASFGASPFLIQHMTGHYGNISISTAGNQIRDAKGMKADIEIDDVRLSDTGNSKGTIGSLDATITWSSDGIKETIQNSIPLVGSFVNGVNTNPSDGTIELQGGAGWHIVAKPTVARPRHRARSSEQKLTGLGFALPREAVQPALDLFSTQSTKGYPLGIHADSVEVTDTGVIAKFLHPKRHHSGR